ISSHPIGRRFVPEAGATFRAGADAVSASNTFTSLPLIDPDTLEFELNVDGFVSYGAVAYESQPAGIRIAWAKNSSEARTKVVISAGVNCPFCKAARKPCSPAGSAGRPRKFV